MNKVFKRVGLTAAALVVVVSASVVSPEPAAAASPIANWKWNAKSIQVQDSSGKIVVVPPGSNAYKAGSRYRAKRVWIPNYCTGNWSTRDKGNKNPFQGGWTNLSTWRQYNGGTVYTFVEPGTANVHGKCSNA